MTRRYPLTDLMRLAGTSLKQIQLRGNLSGREYQRYRDEGVTAIVASRLANLYGFHPCEVWPSWFDDTIEERGIDCRECGVRFLPDRSKQIYCTVACQRRWWSREMNRRRRQPAHPYYPRRLEQQRSYYQETADYQRKQRQARYWADPEKARAERRARWAAKTSDTPADV